MDSQHSENQRRYTFNHYLEYEDYQYNQGIEKEIWINVDNPYGFGNNKFLSKQSGQSETNQSIYICIMSNSKCIILKNEVQKLEF